jgi:hypothetical protein
MLNELQREFGGLAGAQSGYDCLKNAIHNTSLAIAIGMRSQILFVNLSKQRLGSHAYLTDGHEAYSYGLTWRTTDYPELSLQQIAELNGQDVTTMIFWQALQIFGAEDVHRHHVVIDRLARDVPWVVDSVRNFYED